MQCSMATLFGNKLCEQYGEQGVQCSMATLFGANYVSRMARQCVSEV